MIFSGLSYDILHCREIVIFSILNMLGNRKDVVMSELESLTEIMKALAHPVRLQILAELMHDEACVCHLEAVLEQRQAYVSQQLARLRDAGLVVARRDGLNVFYGLADPAIGDLLVMAIALLPDSATGDLSVLIAEPAGDCPCPKCHAHSLEPAPAQARPVEN
jgi:ArsR family transcriptional regulator